MNGSTLHDFDVELCEYVLANIRRHLGKPAFDEAVEKTLAPEVLRHLKALGDDVEPPPMLLNDQEFYDLADDFECGPLVFIRSWNAYEQLHRRSINCVKEIRDELAPEHAAEWARAAVGFAKQLESDRVRLHQGIQIVHQWVSEIRRLLRAMNATAFLPRPEGAFPTPTSPEPPTEASNASVDLSASSSAQVNSPRAEDAPAASPDRERNMERPEAPPVADPARASGGSEGSSFAPVNPASPGGALTASPDREGNIERPVASPRRQRESTASVIQTTPELAAKENSVAVLAVPPESIKYLTTDEAAVYLRTTVQGVYSVVKRGRLKPMPGTRKLLFTRESLDDYVRRRKR